MIVAVLDTNVLASGVAGIARQESTPGELLRRWRVRSFALVVSEPILAELARTLANPYFAGRLSPAETDEILARLRIDAHVRPITVSVAGVATHPQDDAIIATALSAGAAYLVTGGRGLRERGSYRGAASSPPASSSISLNGPKGTDSDAGCGC